MADHEHDDSSSDSEEEVTRNKQSRKLRAKKFFATKTAATKLGRKVITHYIGESANELLENLKSACKRDAGKAVSEKMVKNILKLALKAKLLNDEKLISQQHMGQLVDPVNDMTTKLYEGLEYEGEMPAHMIALVAAKFQSLEELIVLAVQHNMTPKNVNKLRGVINYYGSEKFLTLLLNDPKYKKERESVEKAVSVLVAPLLEEQNSQRAMCSKCDCELPHVGAQGKFRGSTLCAMHHSQVYCTYIKKPSVMHFITTDGKDYKAFQQFAEKNFAKNSTALVSAITNYKNAAANVRRLFAEAIYEKYLGDNATHKVDSVKPETVAKCKAAIAESQDRKLPSENAYDAVCKELLTTMEAAFEKDFKPSKAHKEYVSSLELPKHLKKEAALQQKEWDKNHAK